MKINYKQLKDMYQISCIIFIPATISVSIWSQPIDYIKCHDKIINPFKPLIKHIGYATIGFMIGATYPISFPIAAIYTINDIKKENDNQNQMTYKLQDKKN